MTMLSRRSMMQGIGLATLATALPSKPILAQPAFRGGCCLRCAQARGLGGTPLGMVASVPHDLRIATSSGDAETDHFLGLALTRLATTFDVNPVFAFYDDGTKLNAFASPTQVKPDTTGVVLMGKHLFSQRMADGDAGLSVIAICAHEFGHIHQMQRGYDHLFELMDPTVRPCELHADFLAGFYLAQRKQEHPDLDIQNVGRVFYSIGDTNFNAPQHHGTPEERIAAISAGYKLGETKHTIDEASVAGIAFVRRMI